MTIDEMQKIEDYYIDVDKLTEVYQGAGRKEIKEKVKNKKDFIDYLKEQSAYWHKEGTENDHYFYHQLGDIADKHLKLLTTNTQ